MVITKSTGKSVRFEVHTLAPVDETSQTSDQSSGVIETVQEFNLAISSDDDDEELSLSDASTNEMTAEEFIDRNMSCLVEAFKNDPFRFPFRELCKIMSVFDLDSESDLIKDAITMYSLKIYGFPDYHRSDLYLSVYFFLEEVFGIEAGLELCVRYAEDDANPNVVGIVLTKCRHKSEIVRMADDLLSGSGVRIRHNHDMDWILDGFYCHEEILTN